MLFGPDHYTRDWALLERVAAEWEEIRKKFGLGKKAKQTAIEKVVDDILIKGKEVWPAIRQLHDLLLTEYQHGPFRRHLWMVFKQLEVHERMGFKFEDILERLLQRIFWMVCRNASKWLETRGDSEHWARYWDSKKGSRNLKEEIRRLIRALSGLPVRRPKKTDRPKAEDRESGSVAPAGFKFPRIVNLHPNAMDQSTVQSKPGDRAAHGEEVAATLETAKRCLSEEEHTLFETWVTGCLAQVARRDEEVDRQQVDRLREVIRIVAREHRRRPRTS